MKPKDKNIDPLDSNGQWHGYQEWYWKADMLWYRGYWKHDKEFGYEENHKSKTTSFYIR